MIKIYFISAMAFAAYSALMPNLANALELERPCICQGYGRTEGFHVVGKETFVEDAWKFARQFCETGNNPNPVSGGLFCVPAACPAGMIDLGVSITKCRGLSKSRNLNDGTPDVFAPSEGGCNYDHSVLAISCDIECERVRHCSTP